MSVRQSVFETEHKLLPRLIERAYTPTSGEKDREGNHGNLAIESIGGDWSWKPNRQGRANHGRWEDGVKITKPMITFYGVPKGAAELYGPRIHS